MVGPEASAPSLSATFPRNWNQVISSAQWHRLPQPPACRPRPYTLGGLTSSPGQSKECEEVGGGGEEREPPGRDKGAESERETQRREEVGKIGEVGQGHGEGLVKSGGPIVTQPRRASRPLGAVCAAPWRKTAVRRWCGPDAGGEGCGTQRGQERRREKPDAPRNTGKRKTQRQNPQSDRGRDRHRCRERERQSQSPRDEKRQEPSDTETVIERPPGRKRPGTQSDTET